MKFIQSLFSICKQINPLNVIMVMLMLALSTAQAQTEAATQVDETTQQAIKQMQQFIDIEIPKTLREKQPGDPRVQSLTFYQANANGTVKDKLLKLTWMRCSLGQTWTGRRCDGEAKAYKWEQAKQAAQQMRFADHSDWRLPTIEELKSLVYCSKGVEGDRCANGSQMPTLFQSLFPNTLATFYWSASPHANDSGYAWGVHFDGGGGGSGYRYFLNHVRLVRSGQ